MACKANGGAIITYTKSGPFTNGSLPSINSGFLNALENYLTPGNAKNGVPLCAWAGPYTATTTLTAHAHNLVDASGAALTPDVVFVTIAGNSSTTAHNCYWDDTTLTNTQVKIIADANLTVYFLSLKF